MKNLLSLIVFSSLISSASANDRATKFISLKEGDLKKEISINNACNLVAKKYARAIEKSVKRGKISETDLPLLRESTSNGDLIVHGDAAVNELGERVVRLTYTYPDAEEVNRSTTRTIRIDNNQNSMITIPSLNGDMPLVVHVGEGCTRVSKKNETNRYLCNGELAATKEYSENYFENNTESGLNTMLPHMKALAEFGEKHNLQSEVRINSAYVKACLTQNEVKGFDAYEVFKKMIPNTRETRAEFAGGTNGGMGGSSAPTVRVVSR